MFDEAWYAPAAVSDNRWTLTGAAHLQHDVHALRSRQGLILWPAERVRTSLHEQHQKLLEAMPWPVAAHGQWLNDTAFDCGTEILHGGMLTGDDGHSDTILGTVPPSARVDEPGPGQRGSAHQHDVQQHAAGPDVGSLGVVRLALGGQDDLRRQVRRRADPRPRRALKVLVLHGMQKTFSVSPFLSGLEYVELLELEVFRWQSVVAWLL